MADFLSHALWAYALFRNDPQAPAYVLFSLLPDLAFGVPALVLFFARGGRFETLRRLRFRPHEAASKLPYFATVRRMYLMGHSWVGLGLLVLLAAVFDPEIAKPLALGVFLHLGLDLFTHKHSPAGQRPLFPLSNWKVEGFVHWSEPRFLALNYGLLALVYALIWLRVL